MAQSMKGSMKKKNEPLEEILTRGPGNGVIPHTRDDDSLLWLARTPQHHSIQELHSLVRLHYAKKKKENK